MSATACGSAHPWVATHRVLLAVVAVALAVTATVVIVLMTSAGSSPAPGVRAPDQGQTDPQNPVPKPAQPDVPRKCLVPC